MASQWEEKQDSRITPGVRRAQGLLRLSRNAGMSWTEHLRERRYLQTHMDVSNFVFSGGQETQLPDVCGPDSHRVS
ncbi:Polycystic Kidney Disease Protein 1-Like 2 [Manis pentadactyla]|nr:Polycystic Kidney Disease Protein 1-Like 2 [Manis pentadactyla]